MMVGECHCKACCTQGMVYIKHDDCKACHVSENQAAKVAVAACSVCKVQLCTDTHDGNAMHQMQRSHSALG